MAKKCSKCGSERQGPICPSCSYEHKRGGARPGAGGKKREIAPVISIDGRTRTGQEYAQYLIDRLNHFTPKEILDEELSGWRRLWDSNDKRIALETRRYLYDRAKGKATITVNHLHDKPQEITGTVTLQLNERFRLAIQKADARARALR